MAKERVLDFNCPMRIKIVLPDDCGMDEQALKARIEAVGIELFNGLCESCPRYRDRNKG